MRFLLFLALLLSSFCSARAREFVSAHYTRANGLASNTVYEAYQDDDGYMWFGTDNGVSRFNGIRFENYTTAEGLPDNECFFFFKDVYGRLWISTYNGMLVYYQDGKFHTAANTPWMRLPFKGGTIITMHQEADSSITMFFRNRTQFISVYKDRIKYYPVTPQARNDTSTFIVNVEKKGPNRFCLILNRKIIEQDSNGRLLSISPLRDNKGAEIRLHKHFSNRGFYSSDSMIYSSNLKPLMKISPSTRLNKMSIQDIMNYDGREFICTNYGLLVDGRICFNNIVISNIFRDREGALWLCTSGDGIFRLKPDFLRTFTVSNAYSSPVLFASAIPGRLIFVTRTRTLHVFEDDSCIFRYDPRIHHPSDINKDIKSGSAISGNSLINIGHDVSYSIGNINSGYPFYKGSSVIPTGHISLVYELGNYFYCITRADVSRIPIAAPNTKLVSVFPNLEIEDLHKLTLYGSVVIGKSLWFSSLDSIYTIDSTGAAAGQRQFGNISFKEMYACKDRMAGITFDNRLILAKNFDTDAIQMDSSVLNNCVWNRFYRINDTAALISTNGRYRMLIFSGQSFSLQVVENGLVPEQAEYVSSDGQQVYFFSRGTITQLPVQELFRRDAPPQITFAGLVSNHNTYGRKDNISLSFNDSRNISIPFHVHSFNEPNVVIEYAVSVADQAPDKWIEADGEQISLVRIQPGAYTIKIRCRTQGGNYSRTDSLRLIIGKPFWMSWWFVLSAVVLVILLSAAVIRRLVRKKTREQEKELRLVKSEYQALNALMNPHFVFNSLNNVQGMINRDDRESASEYLRTISDLIRQNMYNISGDFISLEKEMLLVTNYLKLEQLRFKDRLQYEIIIDDDIETDRIMIPPLLVQPLVENAIKYGILHSGKEKGTVMIEITQSEALTFIDVTDNGKGLQQNANDSQHQSTALSNIQKRLKHISQLHHKKITLSVAELKDAGSMVTGVRSRICIYD